MTTQPINTTPEFAEFAQRIASNISGGRARVNPNDPDATRKLFEFVNQSASEFEAQTGQPREQIFQEITQPESDGGGIMDFLTTSLVGEGVLDNIRDQGFFGRIGANVLGELTNPLGIASTALLATGVGAPIGAGIKAATLGTKLAPAGRLAASALTPVASSAKGLGPSQILRSPGTLGRSLGAEAAVGAGAIAAGGAAQEAGQLIPGPTRSVPGQVGLGLAGGLVGAGGAARTVNRVLDPEVARLEAIARPNPVEAEIPELGAIRKNFERALDNEEIIARERAAGRARQAESARAAGQGIDDPFERTAAEMSGARGGFVDRQRFEPLATTRPSEADPSLRVLDGPTELGLQQGFSRDTFVKVIRRADEVYANNDWQRRRATVAFTDLMTGEVPAPGEMELLRPVIGDAFVDQIKAVVSGRGKRAAQALLEIGGIPRTFAASFDLSSMLRQGGPLNIAHPRVALQSWKAGVKAIGNEKFARELNAKHLADPDVQFMNQGLDPQDQIYLHALDAPDIARREESYISPLVGSLPGIKQSEQFFATSLNTTRLGLMKQKLQTLREQHPQLLEPGNEAQLIEYKRRVNRMINSFTGRGSLGFLERPTGARAEQIGLVRDFLSVAFWSPRLLVSRFQAAAQAMSAMRNINAEDPAIRQLSREIARDVATYAGGVTAAISSLALLPGVSVETNPKSSDFGKVRLGDTRIDPWAGFQQIGRYATQFITGERKSASDGTIREADRDRTLGMFLRSKLAPGLPSLVASDLPQDFLLSGFTGGGENFIGEPITGGDVTPGAGIRALSGEAFGAPGVGQLPAEMNVLIDQMVPLLAQDIAEALESGGAVSGTAAGFGSVFGLGSTSFGDNSRVEFVNDQRAQSREPIRIR